MPEQFVGNDVSPRHFPAGGQRAAHVFQIKIARVVGHVPHGHIGIKEHHGLALLPRHRFVEYPEQIAPGKQFLFVTEIGLHAPHETLVAKITDLDYKSSKTLIHYLDFTRSPLFRHRALFTRCASCRYSASSCKSSTCT